MLQIILDRILDQIVCWSLETTVVITLLSLSSDVYMYYNFTLDSLETILITSSEYSAGVISNFSSDFEV